jgi:hypothetical protein
MSLTKVSAGVLNIDDLFGFRNRIINGDMRIDQRNAGASVSVSGLPYTLDRWQAGAAAPGVFSVQQSTTAPVGFSNSALITVTTNDTSNASGASYRMQYKMEGIDTADLGWGTANAKSVTLSFWVRSSITGTHSVAVNNGDDSRSYVHTYTINLANTWEYKTVIIPGDTSGTWITTTNRGMTFRWPLGVGSTFQTTETESWISGNLWSTPDCVKLIATNGATFYITGVQLEKGTVATPFERRPYGTELALCQRYYFRVNASGTGVYFGSGYNRSTTDQESIIAFPVSMRIVPTSLTTSGTAADYRVNHGTTATNCSSVPVLQSRDTATNGVPLFVVASGLTAGQGSASAASNSSAFLAWSAEL